MNTPATTKLFEAAGIQVFRETKNGVKVLQLVMTEGRIANLTKSQAFEMAHAVTDDLRRSPK